MSNEQNCPFFQRAEPPACFHKESKETQIQEPSSEHYSLSTVSNRVIHGEKGGRSAFISNNSRLNSIRGYVTPKIHKGKCLQDVLSLGL